jgi:hypothetical protein
VLAGRIGIDLGDGLASANTIASAAIGATSPPVRMFGADTPMNTSAPREGTSSRTVIE